MKREPEFRSYYSQQSSLSLSLSHFSVPEQRSLKCSICTARARDSCEVRPKLNTYYKLGVIVCPSYEILGLFPTPLTLPIPLSPPLFPSLSSLPFPSSPHSPTPFHPPSRVLDEPAQVSAQDKDAGLLPHQAEEQGAHSQEPHKQQVRLCVYCEGHNTYYNPHFEVLKQKQRMLVIMASIRLPAGCF